MKQTYDFKIYNGRIKVYIDGYVHNHMIEVFIAHVFDEELLCVFDLN